MPDLVISLMSLAKIPDGVTFEHPPAILHWMPSSTKPGSHPSWTADADKLREPPYRKGRLLPNLVKQFSKALGFGPADVNRICVVGFSAGANNGLRELLRNRDDREAIDVVFSVDGLHPNLRPVPLPGVDEWRAPYAAWDAEMEPFADFAVAAALGERVAVFTCSDVAAPSKVNAKTADALEDLLSDVAHRAAAHAPLADPIIPPGAFPTAPSSPKPKEYSGSRGFSIFWYAGSDKQAHITQGTTVTRDLWRDFLVWRWSPGTAETVSPGPISSTPPVAITPAGKSSVSTVSRVADALRKSPVLGATCLALGLVGVGWSVTR